MAVLKEWMCMAHGSFDSLWPKCPKGCAGETMVRRVFLTAPGLGSGRTKNIDRTLTGLASEYGLSDINNRGGTEAATRVDGQAVKRINNDIQTLMRERYGNPWRDVAKGGSYRVGTGVQNAERGQGALATAQGLGAKSGNALSFGAGGEMGVALPGVGVVSLASPTTKTKVVARYDAKVET